MSYGALGLTVSYNNNDLFELKCIQVLYLTIDVTLIVNFQVQQHHQSAESSSSIPYLVLLLI